MLKSFKALTAIGVRARTATGPLAFAARSMAIAPPYERLPFHFHTPREHTVEGHHPLMAAHRVHKTHRL